MNASQVKKHLLTGVSYMLPLVISGGLLITLITALNNMGWEAEWLTTIQNFGYAIFGFIPHILGAYIAYSIADKPGVIPGFAGGMVASTLEGGFLGGMAAGFIAGFVVNSLKKVPFHPYIVSLKPMMLIPLFGVGITAGLMAFVGLPIGWLQTTLNDFLINLEGTNSLLLGAALGGMLAFDMGGPVNKIALTFVISAYGEGIFGPNAAAFAGIMIPPIAAALSTWIVPSKFNDLEKNSAPSTLVSGIVGITEGAIPYAASNPLKMIPANVAGGAVGGALVMSFGIETKMFGGVFAFPFTQNWFLFFLALLIGTIISVLMIVWLRPKISDESLAGDEII